jgi:hypothetical protein
MAVEIGGRSEMGFTVGTGAAAGGSSAAFVGSGAGVSSTSECLPVVQGGMERNSSNVRTRGLQHFQPARWGLALCSHCDGRCGVVEMLGWNRTGGSG